MENIVGWTLNADANRQGIQIEIVGDFNLWVPSEEQYATVKQLVERIREKYPDIEVKWHGDFQSKNCPWKNFDFSKVDSNYSKQVSNFWEKESQENQEKIEFSLSRYYTVVEWQKRYYGGRTYEEDFKINCQWDCLTTSNGHQLNDWEWWKVVACPKEYALWTKFYVEWIGEVVCHDRGWKIIKQWEIVRLDLWMWVWDKWLDRIYNNSIRWWSYVWYIIK